MCSLILTFWSCSYLPVFIPLSFFIGHRDSRPVRRMVFLVVAFAQFTFQFFWRYFAAKFFMVLAPRRYYHTGFKKVLRNNRDILSIHVKRCIHNMFCITHLYISFYITHLLLTPVLHEVLLKNYLINIFYLAV